MAENIDVFKKNYLVIGLSDEAISEIVKLAEIKTYFNNDVLIRKGEKSSDLFVILEGTAKVITGEGDYLDDVGPGAVIGEVALIDDNPRSADVICVGTVKAAHIPAKKFRSLLNENRDTGFVVLANLARVLCLRLRKASIRIEHLVGQDAWRGSL